MLDSIIERNIENQKSNRRDEDFKSAFKSMVATPKEYTEWQDKGYAKSNKDESIRRDQEDFDAMMAERDSYISKAMSETGALLGAISPQRHVPESSQTTYKDTDLIEAGYGLTQRDLDIQKQWWEEDESGKSFRRTNADWNEYTRIEDLVEEAKQNIMMQSI